MPSKSHRDDYLAYFWNPRIKNSDMKDVIKCWKNIFSFWFLTEEIQYHDGLRSRELGQAPILLCAPNS